MIPRNNHLPESFRRELTGQLATFDAMLKKPRALAPDYLTTKFAVWIADFKEALKEKEVDEVSLEAKYIAILQMQLQDPLAAVPLDVDALLGNDGYTYDKKVLLLHLSRHAEEIIRYRSPMNPENPTRFEVENHPFAAAIVRWLKEKGAFQPSAQLEADYARLVESKKIVPLPTKTLERIRLTRERLMAEQLTQKLVAFGHAFDSCPLQDNLTEGLRNWLQLFIRALIQPEGVGRIENQFIALLQELLKDPLSFQILDEEALLGSDGETYSKKSLLIYLNDTPMIYHYRSPCAPNNQREFTVRPHPLVPLMIGWLKEKGAYHPSEQIEAFYEALIAGGKLPQLPTEENAYIAHLQAQQTALNQKIAEKLQAFEEQSLQSLMERAKAGFAEVDRMLEANGASFEARLKEVQQQDQKQLQQVEEMVKHLETEAEILRARAKDLQQQVDNVDGKIAVVDRQNVQLQAEIEKTRAALKERDSRWLKDFMMFAAVVALRIAITTLAPQATVIPLKEGGMMLGASVPL